MVVKKFLKKFKKVLAISKVFYYNNIDLNIRQEREKRKTMKEIRKMQAGESYELTPKNNRKSFYGKARVVFYENGVKVLYSYNTPVLAKLMDGKLLNLWQDYSNTTGNHIFSFCGLRKKEVEKLELSSLDALNLQQQY